MSVTPLVQYRKMVYFDVELNDAWEQYKQAHPEQSFNGLMISLLKEHLCATNASTLTIP